MSVRAMRYLIAVDVGIKNLGLCVFDFTQAKFVFWENVSLVPNGRYLPADNVQYVRNLVHTHKDYFDEAAVIVVEKQMRCNMRIIEAVLQSMFFDITVIVNARSVKAHYNLGTKNYRLNKQRAVQWADQFVEHNPGAFIENVTTSFRVKHKKDDLADSLLLVTYYLDTYSNQLSSLHALFTILDVEEGGLEL